MICRDAAEIISRSLDASSSRVERAGLAVHTLFCGPCRRFRTQLKQLHAECTTAAADESASGVGLSAAARERITTAIDKAPAD